MVSMKIISGTSNLALAKNIASKLKTKLVSVTINKFADGEIYVRLNENVRGKDLFIIQSTYSNDHLMELLIMIDAAKRASADRITAVIPYYGYARQDRKAESRESITAKLVANLLTIAGANRVLTMDLHSPQIQGFFDIPLDDSWAFPLFIKYFAKKKLKNVVVISPDAGGVKRASRFSKKLNAPIAMIDKRRAEHNKIENMRIIGDVEGKTAIIYDDMIDTGGTVCEAVATLKKEGAKDVYVCATHALLSNNAQEKLNATEVKEILVTNSIPVKVNGKFKVIDLSQLLALAIRNIHENKSVSTLDKQILETKLTQYLKRIKR